MDAAAIRDIVLQLLLPFAVGQLLRPWIADWIARHGLLTKAVDRGSILLIVYTAFSMGMVEHIWRSVDPWQLVAVAVVNTALLMAVLVFTRLIGQLVGLDRGDAIVLLFCGSKKSLASGPSDGAGVLPGRHRRSDHVAADDFSPDTAGGVLGDRQQAGPRSTARRGAWLVAADVDRMGGQQRQRLRLTSQHPAPQIHPRLDQNVRWQRRQHNPVVALDLAPTNWPIVQPAYPAKIRTPSTSGAIDSGSASRSTITIRPATWRRPGTPSGSAPTRSTARHNAASRFTGPPDEHRLRFGGQLGPLRQHIVDSGLAGAIDHHSQRAPVVVLDDVNHTAAEGRLEEIRVGQKQSARSHSVCGGGNIVLRVFGLRHASIMASAPGRCGEPEGSSGEFVLLLTGA